MNYNAGSAARQPPGGSGLGGRKVKRVSDVNAVPTQASNQQQQFMTPTTSAFDAPPAYGNVMGSNEFNAGHAIPPPGAPMGGPAMYANNFPGANQQPMYGQPQFGGMPQNMQSQQPQQPQQPRPGQQPYNPQQPGGPMPQQFAMFQQPIVQDMAMQYTQKLADQGKQMMENTFEKYVPVTKLKYYFAVDNKYVINKLRLLFFPFTHTDWLLKYDQDNPVQPRYDLNAPDLYIPTMAYITYVVLAGLVLGMQDRFTPEQLGIQASSALAYSIFELLIYSVTLYTASISTALKTLDLMAYAGYKFANIVLCIVVSILFRRTGYYIALIYGSASLAFFLLRTLKAKVMTDPNTAADPIQQNPYGAPQQQNYDYTVGRKRKLYFLFLVAGLQPVLSFWLSMHLIPPSEVAAA